MGIAQDIAALAADLGTLEDNLEGVNERVVLLEARDETAFASAGALTAALDRLATLTSRVDQLEAAGAQRQRDIDQLRADAQRLRWQQRTGRQA